MTYPTAEEVTPTIRFPIPTVTLVPLRNTPLSAKTERLLLLLGQEAGGQGPRVGAP